MTIPRIISSNIYMLINTSAKAFNLYRYWLIIVYLFAKIANTQICQNCLKLSQINSTTFLLRIGNQQLSDMINNYCERSAIQT